MFKGKLTGKPHTSGAKPRLFVPHMFQRFFFRAVDDLDLCQAAGFGRHVGDGWAVATMSSTCADL